MFITRNSNTISRLTSLCWFVLLGVGITVLGVTHNPAPASAQEVDTVDYTHVEWGENLECAPTGVDEMICYSAEDGRLVEGITCLDRVTCVDARIENAVRVSAAPGYTHNQLYSHILREGVDESANTDTIPAGDAVDPEVPTFDVPGDVMIVECFEVYDSEIDAWYPECFDTTTGEIVYVYCVDGDGCYDFYTDTPVEVIADDAVLCEMHVITCKGGDDAPVEEFPYQPVCQPWTEVNIFPYGVEQITWTCDGTMVVVFTDAFGVTITTFTPSGATVTTYVSFGVQFGGGYGY